MVDLETRGDRIPPIAPNGLEFKVVTATTPDFVEVDLEEVIVFADPAPHPDPTIRR